MRDLFGGMYGVFRNRFAHSDTESSWHEADAIISMVNYLLKRLPALRAEKNAPKPRVRG
jgi:hypothetical protein